MSEFHNVHLQLKRLETAIGEYARLRLKRAEMLAETFHMLENLLEIGMHTQLRAELQALRRFYANVTDEE
jgi:hypothetical protein